VSGENDLAFVFMKALWAADFDKTDALLSPDATWVFQLGMPQSQKGLGRISAARVALRQIVEDLFGKFDPEGFSVAPTRLIAEGDAVSIEYEARVPMARGRRIRIGS
jgi:ketosteroid isomerase-like protein